MAKLSDEERAVLKRLQDKEKAPDAPPVGKSITANVDLSDEASVARAIKHGFLTAEEVAEDKDDKDDKDDDDSDTPPKRRGYFDK